MKMFLFLCIGLVATLGRTNGNCLKGRKVVCYYEGYANAPTGWAKNYKCSKIIPCNPNSEKTCCSTKLNECVSSTSKDCDPNVDKVYSLPTEGWAKNYKCSKKIPCNPNSEKTCCSTKLNECVSSTSKDCDPTVDKVYSLPTEGWAKNYKCSKEIPCNPNSEKTCCSNKLNECVSSTSKDCDPTVDKVYSYYLSIENIDPTLCTHLIYAFAILDKISHKIVMHKDTTIASYTKFTNLKQKCPCCKMLIAIGGATDSQETITKDGESENKYSNLVKDAKKRKIFVASVVDFLKKHTFDGLDLDWEFPKCEDAQYFELLVEELRTKFNDREIFKEQPLLTAAVGNLGIVNNGYNIQHLCENLDFINLMTYDFAGWWEGTKKGNVEHHSTLWDTELFILKWTDKKCPKEKLIIGVPLYGRSFDLKDKNKNMLHSPAKGKGHKLPVTDEKGYASYIEICSLIKSKHLEHKQKGYAYDPHGYYWVGFDDKKSVCMKTHLATNYGGIMVWSINLDDHRGVCSKNQEGKNVPKTFPLLKSIKNCRQTCCPAGFFIISLGCNNYCFKYISELTTWDKAKEMCEKMHLQLARATDSIAILLRKYLVDNYGDQWKEGVVWLDARGNGTHIVRKHDETVIPDKSSLWSDGLPGSSVSDKNCLQLLTDEDTMQSKPKQPYMITTCDFAYGEALCEYVGK